MAAVQRGFLVGDCVFDVARTFNGKSFRMREHVERLYRSLRYVRIDPGLSPDELERISEEVITRNAHGIIVRTRSFSPDALDPKATWPSWRPSTSTPRAGRS